jgi:DNA modification methylase
MEPTPPLRLEWLSPSELAENPANWRRHPDAQLTALTDVIGEVGWAGACLFNERTGRLIDGHARRKVALDQGTEKVPVLIGNWTEEQERKILATLDPLAAMAEADATALDALLRDVQTGSEAVGAMLTELATQNGIVPALPDPAQDPGAQPDRAAELRAKWKTATGQLWEIPSKATPGKAHRLLCGDSTKAEDVGRVMGGGKAGLCFTSPPYAQQRQYTKKITDWDGLMQGVFSNVPMTEDGQILVNLGLVHDKGEWQPYWESWIEWMRAQGWRRFGWYVWDQLSGFPGVFGGRCAPSFEFIFHFNKAATTAEKHVKTKSEGTTRKGGAMRENGWEEDAGRIRTTGALKIPDAVWRVGRSPDADIEHPALFPVALSTMALETWPAELAYDPFLGSGTTIAAAEQTARIARGIEISPAYVAVSLERLEGMGLEPKLT